MECLFTLIKIAIASKKGSQEFVLRWDGDSVWYAGIGNPTNVCWIGEVEAQFEASSSRSPQDAVSKLIGSIGSQFASAKPL